MFLNIAGYRFISLSSLTPLRESLLSLCKQLSLKGTILLSHEGINLNLAGLPASLTQFIAFLEQDERFNNMAFHRTYSNFIPFKRLKIKLKKEIITFRQEQISLSHQRTPAVLPQQLKTWLDEKQDVVLIDVRNDYEYAMGSFKDARHLNLKHFDELPQKLSETPLCPLQKIVMFCTGGIRCEKAGLYFNQQNLTKVYQLQGGILGYFAEVGGDHYQGHCFVFDDRIALDSQLNSCP